MKSSPSGLLSGLQVVAGLERLPGDGAGLVGGEMDEDLGDVFRGGEAPRILLRISLGSHVGARGAGVHTVDPNPRRLELGREHLGESLETELGNGIGAPVGLSL